MVRKYILPVLSGLGVFFAVWMAVQAAKPVPPSKPIAEPPRPVYENKISGAGMVEASSRNIAVGTPVSGIVTRVMVRVGNRVKAGDPLFVLDDRKQRADLQAREAALEEAKARLRRLKELPRLEDLPPAYAKVKEAEAVLEDVRVQLELVEKVNDKRAISIEDLNKRRFAVQAAEARLARARADLTLLEAGAWKPDLEVTQAEVSRAESEVRAAKVEIERLTVTAPLAGEVLQINIRPGEFAQSGVLAQPLILLGDLDKLHVRVDIDENDAWRFHPQSSAEAYVRGNPKLKTRLTFEYVEPYVVPKRSLTGESSERVDTRVMQVIYSFKRANLPVYPGQLMDVFIEDRPGRPPGPADRIPKGGKP
ncbi:MAG: efflux RND transporter periplasmic adaptor subunit [Syntrophaceae bacterium]|nr:efflux RND transporter periplasmic adaptor subunit [Syntrophaceae bacterium]